MGLEDSEVDLKYILTHASRRSSRIFEIFSTKQRTVSTQLQAKRGGRSARDRESCRKRRSVQDNDDKGDLWWTEACEGIVRKMSKYLEDSDVTKVSTRELEEQVVSPNKSKIRCSRKEKRRSSSLARRHGMND